MDLASLLLNYGPQIEAELREGKDPAELLRQFAPDLAAAIAFESKKTELHRRTVFTADLASRFLQSSVETLEHPAELEKAARRAVLLATFVIAESSRIVDEIARRGKGE